MAQLSSTRIQGIGCGSAPLGRNTNQRGRLTTPISPSVEPIPSRPPTRSPPRSRRSSAPSTPTPAAPAAPPVRPQRRAQRLHQGEQRRALMPDLVHERRRDAVADHPLAGHPDQGDRVLAAAGQPGPGPADRRARAAVQVADHRGSVEEAAGQPQRVGGGMSSPRARHRSVLTALGDDLGEQVELRQRV